ncbi:MAG: antitoxin family protein, partial [Coleofasciculaceae cyanobacterium SM2_3_26]|nr:antitoxin family protein [Coleofasciculaceae cyanobacterium SM2_3_26]
MTIAAKAIYEGGVLKLSQPIPLAEGTQVEASVISTKIPEKSSPSEILARIAALPMEGNSDEFSGRDR